MEGKGFEAAYRGLLLEIVGASGFLVSDVFRFLAMCVRASGRGPFSLS